MHLANVGIEKIIEITKITFTELCTDISDLSAVAVHPFRIVTVTDKYVCNTDIHNSLCNVSSAF